MCGWLLTANLPDEMRIVEIIIATPFRNRGIGGAAIRTVQAHARAEEKAVRLSVSTTNSAAIRLYESLGFRRIGGDGMNDLMEYLPVAP
jgi:ribosomal protein S18 acetylase RimI-like enzyme